MRNKFDNPTAFNIQNELRQMAEKTNADFNITGGENRSVTEFKCGVTLIRLFERNEEDAYLKFIHGENENDEDYDLLNYNVKDIKEIEFNMSTMRIYITGEDGFVDWGVDYPLD